MRAAFIFLALWMTATFVRAQFDVSQVVDFDIRIDPTSEGTEVSPFPLAWGEWVKPRVTAVLRDGTAGVAVPAGYYSFASLDTNVVRIAPDGSWVAAGSGLVSVGTYVGIIPRWRQIKVVSPAPRITHRYSFETGGDLSLVLDSVGAAHGWLTNQSNGGSRPVLSNGEAAFDAAGGYVALPPEIISAHTNFSFALWVTANGNTNFRIASRVLDFASMVTNVSSGGPAGLGLDLDYPRLRARWGDMPKEASASGSFEAEGQGSKTGLVVAVVAPQANQFGFPGQYISTSAGLPLLNTLADGDNRIGNALAGGLAFNGRLSELRLYEGVLSAFDVKLARRFGPEIVPPPLGELRRVRFGFEPAILELGSTQYATVRVFGDFLGATNIDLLANGLATLGVSAPTVALRGGNQIELLSLGAASVTAYSTASGAALAAAGVPIAPPRQVRIVLNPDTTMIGARDFPSTFSVRADFGLVTNLDVTSHTLTDVGLSDSNVLTLWPGARLAPVLAGRARLTARLLTAAASVEMTVTNPPGFAAAWPRLVHRWEFTGTAGMRDATNSVSDVTAYGRRLCQGLGGSYGSLPAFTGTRAFLDGVGSYFTIYSSPFAGLSNGTIEAWVDCVNPDYEHLFSAYMPADPFIAEACRGQSMPIAGYVALSMGGIAAFKPAGVSTNDWYELQAPGSIPNHRLTHLAWVHAPSLGVAELYVDGVRVDATPTHAPLSAGATPAMWLGRNSLAPDEFFYGYLYEFRIYDGALAPTQIVRNRDFGSAVVSFNHLVTNHPFLPQVTPDRQRLKLHIPNPRSGFRLETSPTLNADALWTPVLTPIQIEADETVSVEVPLGSQAYYRLHLMP